MFPFGASDFRTAFLHLNHTHLINQWEQRTIMSVHDIEHTCQSYYCGSLSPESLLARVGYRSRYFLRVHSNCVGTTEYRFTLNHSVTNFGTWERIWADTRERERERARDRQRERQERDPVTWCHTLQLFKTLHTGQTEMFWSVLTFLGSYGFRENTDRMAESIHKNVIYSKVRNATEFVNFGMNKRRSVT